MPVKYWLPVAALLSFNKTFAHSPFSLEEALIPHSDNMIWPDAIGIGIKVINDAPFLTEQQKRNILFNKATGFLRLSADDQRRMYGQ